MVVNATEKRASAFLSCFLTCALFASNTCGVLAIEANNDHLQQTRQSGDVSFQSAGDVVVTINEQLLNSILDAVLVKPPSFPLTKKATGKSFAAPSSSSFAAARQCASVITLAREINGVRTRVRIADGKITAPVAFRGSYDGGSLLGCYDFEGWADTEIALAFNVEAQALRANIRVRNVNLTGFPTTLGGSITGIVQSAIDARFNPLELLRTAQLSTRVPLSRNKTNEAINMRAKEVRAEIVTGEVRLHISYEVARSD